MEKLNFVRDGVIRLPPGFCFQPTDEELVFQYLKRKIFSCPLPASIIPEINVFKYDPWDLPGDLKQEKYFFCQKEVKYQNGNQINNRTTGSGYWKATGVDRQIASSSRNQQIMGMKKTLVFYRGKPPHGSRTDWIMHEYRLIGKETTACIFPQTKNSNRNSLSQMGDWVLCRIFLWKRSRTIDYVIVKTCEDNRVGNVIGMAKPKFFDSTLGDRTACLSPISSSTSTSSSSSSSSSSNSSGITEVLSSGSDHEESSDYNSSSSSCFRREP